MSRFKTSYRSVILSGVTEKKIEKILQSIAQFEGIIVPQTQIIEISQFCNKDVRNAIQTMQFYRAGKEK